ncbi:hypothetical protein K438DRAFT_1892291 [Mycena galopus ATCC 62051]|nr:hypothetical protein K438DRAFT_1892291 [Mycena galopus ATCC 62051]
MKLCHYISQLFILSLYMTQCLFCNKHFSDSGLCRHTTKCTARTQCLRSRPRTALKWNVKRQNRDGAGYSRAKFKHKRSRGG